MSVIRRLGPFGLLPGKRILLVEDDAMVAMLLEEALAEAGASILGPVGTVEAALGLITVAEAQGGIAAAVLDLDLNGFSALPVADRLAALRVPILFATGYGEGCQRGHHAAVPLLLKPFQPAVLVGVLGALVGVQP